MDNDESVDTILDTVGALIQVQNQLIQQHRRAIERLFAEIERLFAEIERLFAERAEIKKRIPDKLKPPDALDSTDVEFVANITARLKAILSTLNQEKL